MAWPKVGKVQGQFSGSGSDQFGYGNGTTIGNETIL